jgi:hypothetical protein
MELNTSILQGRKEHNQPWRLLPISIGFQEIQISVKQADITRCYSIELLVVTNSFIYNGSLIRTITLTPAEVFILPSPFIYSVICEEWVDHLSN